MDQFLAPETVLKCQFLILGPETDILCQFLEPETDIMGERNYIEEEEVVKTPKPSQATATQPKSNPKQLGCGFDTNIALALRGHSLRGHFFYGDQFTVPGFLWEPILCTCILKICCNKNLLHK